MYSGSKSFQKIFTTQSYLRTHKSTVSDLFDVPKKQLGPFLGSKSPLYGPVYYFLLEEISV